MQLEVYDITLQEELGKLVALIVRERERLEKLNSKEVIQEITILTKAFEAATRSKLALDKAQVAREKSLTPEQELEQVKLYIMGYTPMNRVSIIEDLVKRHNAKGKQIIRYTNE